jgi:hypothetical protein
VPCRFILKNGNRAKPVRQENVGLFSPGVPSFDRMAFAAGESRQAIH